MVTTGAVRSWYSGEGWGVVDSPDTPGGCWVHFSAIKTVGYKMLVVGHIVDLEWQAADQDGYSFRAVGVWPIGTEAVETPSENPPSAYSSTLTITFDAEP